MSQTPQTQTPPKKNISIQMFINTVEPYGVTNKITNGRYYIMNYGTAHWDDVTHMSIEEIRNYINS